VENKFDFPVEKKQKEGEAEKEAKEKEVKQAAEPIKPGKEILKQEIEEGLKETERPASGLLISGLSAGLDLGFSVLLMGVVMSLSDGAIPEIAKQILVALSYSAGFIFVIIGQSELFTEHTTLAVLPVLNKQSTIGKLLRLWGLVYVSNIVGATLIALLISVIGPALGVVKPEAIGEIARPVVSHPAGVIFLSAILAGWLMGLVSWLVTAARETVSQVLIIMLITFTIGFAHLHHSIAGTTEVLTGLFANQGITLPDFLHFLLWTTLGNIVGGVVFVALLKYGHVMRSGPKKEANI
jgi:formate-nitrite transporter family protein